MQLPSRTANLLPGKSLGVQLLIRDAESQGTPQSPGGCVRPSGVEWDSSGGPDYTAAAGVKLYARKGSCLPGTDCPVEELAVLGRRVAWTAGHRVRKLLTLEAEVQQATWALFSGYSDDPVLCLLSSGCLTTCTLGGRLQESAVPPGLDAMWPAGDGGVLLGGASTSSLYLLSHPMDVPKPVVADVSHRAGRQGAYAGWMGEQVLWSSYELPYVATYSEAAGRIAVWAVGPPTVLPGVLGDLPDLPAVTPMGGAGPGPMTGVSHGTLGPPTQHPPPPGAPGAMTTPASRVSMFSFQPHAAGGGGGGGGYPGFGTAGAAGRGQVRGLGGAVRPVALSTPTYGLTFGQAQHQHHHPPYPPSAAPSDMSMAYTPAGPSAPSYAPPPQHPHVSTPYPPSAAPSDMSVDFSVHHSVGPSGPGTGTTAGRLGVPGAAAAAAGRFVSPYGGGHVGGASPMMQTPRSQWGVAATPGGSGMPGGSGAVPGSALKRTPAARTREGFLSPHLFNPVPRAPAPSPLGTSAPYGASPGPATQHSGHQTRPLGTPFSALNGAEGGGHGGGGGHQGTPWLLRGGPSCGPGSRTAMTALSVLSGPGGCELPEECRVLELLHEEVLQPGCRPTEAVMVSNLSGWPLLCVLCDQQARLLAFTITPIVPAGAGAAPGGGMAPSAALAGGVRVAAAGSLAAVAVAAVAATRMRITEPGSPMREHRDLLALLPSGQLVLHRGLSPLFELTLGAQPPCRLTSPAVGPAARSPAPHSNPPGGGSRSLPLVPALGPPPPAHYQGGAGPGPGAPGAGIQALSPVSRGDSQDMMLDDSDSEHDSHGAGEGAHRGSGVAGALVAGRPSDAAVPANAVPTAVHSARKVPASYDDFMSDGDDMMLTSPPLADGLSTAAHVLVPSSPPPAPPGGRSAAHGASDSAHSASRMVGLCRGVGNTVVVQLGQLQTPPPWVGGAAAPGEGPPRQEVRALLPFHVTSPLAAWALEVVRATTPPHLYLAFLRRFYAHRPPATSRTAGEWAAVDAVLLEWAADPAAFAESSRHPPSAGGIRHPSAARRSDGHASGSSGGGGYEPPATPLHTPLHTRRFAAMSLASPIRPRPPRPHSQPAVPVLQPRPSGGPSATGAAAAGGPAGEQPGAAGGLSAWERFLGSETQARLMAGPRCPTWMKRTHWGAGGKEAAGTCSGSHPLNGLHVLLSGGGGGTAVAPDASPPPPLGAAAQPLLAVLYGLHGVYEELKLDVLHWPLLRSLGCSLAAVACVLGLHSYWEHYARDLGPPVLVAAGAPEPPLVGPRGLTVRPPADVHRLLGRMLCGAAPEPNELPSLLEPSASAALTAPAGSSTGPPSHPVLPLTSRLLACYSLLCECAKSCSVLMLQNSSGLLAPRAPASPGPASAAAPAAALEAAVRSASQRLVALVAAQGWNAASLGRLAPGVVLPLREAFQRCRMAPPPGWPVQAYALIGREDIAATLAPAGTTTAANTNKTEDSSHVDNTAPATAAVPTATSPPIFTPTAAAAAHHYPPPRHRSGSIRMAGAPGGVAAAEAGAARGPAAAAPPRGGPAASFASMLSGLPGLRTAPSGALAAAEEESHVTPTATAAGVGGGGLSGLGPGPLTDSTGAPSGGGDSSTQGASPLSASSLFSFPQMPYFSLGAADTPINAPAGVVSGGGNGGGALVPRRAVRLSAAPPAPRAPPSHMWYTWRPAYTARLQLPSHQLDLGAELDAPRKLEGAAKQFESKHGMEGLTRGVSRLRFGRDGRLREVISALDSSHPLLLQSCGLHEADPEAPARHQQQLLAAALRTMSLPLGRGAVALATGRPLPTEPTAAVPSMCLAGLVPDALSGHTVINLDLSTAQPAPGGGAAADFTAWPEFHNGAAEGLRLSAAGGDGPAGRSWLQVVSKPDVPSYTHAGLLMALGLRGQLDRMTVADVYKYLSDQHDPTTIAVLVGMAAQRRATMDETVAKMLFLHLPARHPTTFPELELSPLVQAASLLGVGLLYEGSGHRMMAETLVEEIGRRPLSPAAAAVYAASSAAGGGRRGGARGGGAGGPGASALGGSGVPLPPGASPFAVTSDREGYALAAGLALGMVVLGLGGSRAAAGLADLQLEERLTYYMLGSTDASAAARRAGGQWGSQGSSAGGGFVSGLDRVFGPGPGGAKLGHAVALWGGDSAGPPALAAATGGRGGEAGHGAGSNGQGVATLVLEPDNLLATSLTSPAATVALALMYLRTNDPAIASRFRLPATPFDLDAVRPDCICLRALGAAMVMWDSIEPSRAWLDARMPLMFRGPLERLVDKAVAAMHSRAHGGPGPAVRGGAAADVHAVAVAHVSALSGLCMAIGLKYAGSANSRAYETLRSVALSLLAAKRRLPEVVPSSTAGGTAGVVTGAGQVAGGGPAAVGRLDRAPVEAALSVVVLALSAVMAGTGHLPTFHLLQALSQRRHPTHHHVLHSLGIGYGAHCAVSMALGLLFMGAGTYTLSTTNTSVAALLVALFPVMPHTPTDNRYHLQVFRHLYVLAARRRCLQAVDIDSQQLVYVPLQLTVAPPRVVPEPEDPRGARQQRGRQAGAGGQGQAGADVVMEEELVLKTSTKANLPWTPDGQLRPGLSPGAALPAAAPPGSGHSGGTSGSPPLMLEALHLEGDSPEPAAHLRGGPTLPAAGATGPPLTPLVATSPAARKAATQPGAPGAGAAPAVQPALQPRVQTQQPPNHQPQGVGSGCPPDDESPLLTYERVAPSLLPEPHHTVCLAVRGPRYWPQQLDWSARVAVGAGAEQPTTVTGGIALGAAGRAVPAAAAAAAGGQYGQGSLGLMMTPVGGGVAVAQPQPPPPRPPQWITPAAAASRHASAAAAIAARSLPYTVGSHSVSGANVPTTTTTAVARAAGGAGGVGGSGGSALEITYQHLLLFVKKRAGSLSYSEDPSGIRSLLSRAFHAQGLLQVPRAPSLSPHGAPQSAATNTTAQHHAAEREAGDGPRRQLVWPAHDHAADVGGEAPLGPAGEDPAAADTGGTAAPTVNTAPTGSTAALVGDAGTGPSGGGPNPASGGSEDMGSGFDLVQLCATFSADPSIMAFAQHIKMMRDLWILAEAEAAACRTDTSGAPEGVSMRRGLLLLAPATHGSVTTATPRACRRRSRHGADLLTFCYSALYECITGEKTAALQLYLYMQCLVHRAAVRAATRMTRSEGASRPLLLHRTSSSGGSGGPGPLDGSWAAGTCMAVMSGPVHPGSSLTGPEVPLTSALRGLQLAREYYGGPLAAAAAAAASGAVFLDPDEQALWRPMLQPAFLDSLWCTLQHRRWRPLGLLPAPGGGAAGPVPGVSGGLEGGRAATVSGGGAVPAAEAGTAAAGCALEMYLRRGRMLSAADFEAAVPGVSERASESELQTELARCLALHQLPPLTAVHAALTQLRALPAWQQLSALAAAAAAGSVGHTDAAKTGSGGGGGVGGGAVPPSWAMLPLLSLLLPGLSHDALLMLSAAVPL